MAMFAAFGAVCFFLRLINVHLGSVDLVVLGWLFLAVHFAFGSPVVVPAFRRQPPR